MKKAPGVWSRRVLWAGKREVRQLDADDLQGAH